MIRVASDTADQLAHHYTPLIPTYPHTMQSPKMPHYIYRRRVWLEFVRSVRPTLLAIAPLCVDVYKLRRQYRIKAVRLSTERTGQPFNNHKVTRERKSSQPLNHRPNNVLPFALIQRHVYRPRLTNPPNAVPPRVPRY